MLQPNQNQNQCETSRIPTSQNSFQILSPSPSIPLGQKRLRTSEHVHDVKSTQDIDLKHDAPIDALLIEHFTPSITTFTRTVEKLLSRRNAQMNGVEKLTSIINNGEIPKSLRVRPRTGGLPDNFQEVTAIKELTIKYENEICKQILSGRKRLLKETNDKLSNLIPEEMSKAMETLEGIQDDLKNAVLNQYREKLKAKLNLVQISTRIKANQKAMKEKAHQKELDEMRTEILQDPEPSIANFIMNTVRGEVKKEVLKQKVAKKVAKKPEKKAEKNAEKEKPPRKPRPNSRQKNPGQQGKPREREKNPTQETPRKPSNRVNEKGKGKDKSYRKGKSKDKSYRKGKSKGKGRGSQ